MELHRYDAIRGKCPYCHRDVAFSWVETNVGEGRIQSSPVSYKNKNGRWALGECPSCRKCVVLHSERTGQYHRMEILPYPLPQKPNERIPPEIRNSLYEARKCFSVGAYMATVAMCRRALQSACIDKGANRKKKLREQIDELEENEIINKTIQEWAHSVRWVGNDGAHPENPEVTEEDAEDILKLTQEMMHILYILPEIAKEKRKVHGKQKGA